MPQRPTFNELADVQVQENSGSHSATVTGLSAGEAQRACLTLAAPLFKTLLAGIDPGTTERRMTFAVDSTNNELISELLITTHDTSEWAGSVVATEYIKTPSRKYLFAANLRILYAWANSPPPTTAEVSFTVAAGAYGQVTPRRCSVLA